MLPLIAIGLSLTVLGLFLVRRFQGRADAQGIGAFRLLPLAGLAWLAGLLSLVTGGLLLLLALSTLWTG